LINPGLWFKEIKAVKKVACFCGGGMLVIALLLPPVFPLVTGLFMDIFGGVPFSFSLTVTKILPATFDAYSWSFWITGAFLMILVLFALILGMGGLAGEVSKGTAVFLTSKPISARDVVTTKFFAASSWLAALALVPNLVFSISALVSGHYFTVGPLWVSSLVALCGAITVYTGTLLFSSLLDSPFQALLASIGFWFLVSLPGYFKGTILYSLFFHMKSPEYLMEGQSPFIHLGVLLVFIFLLYEFTVYSWERREF